MHVLLCRQRQLLFLSSLSRYIQVKLQSLPSVLAAPGTITKTDPCGCCDAGVAYVTGYHGVLSLSGIRIPLKTRPFFGVFCFASFFGARMVLLCLLLSPNASQQGLRGV